MSIKDYIFEEEIQQELGWDTDKTKLAKEISSLSRRFRNVDYILRFHVHEADPSAPKKEEPLSVAHTLVHAEKLRIDRKGNSMSIRNANSPVFKGNGNTHFHLPVSGSREWKIESVMSDKGQEEIVLYIKYVGNILVILHFKTSNQR